MTSRHASDDVDESGGVFEAVLGGRFPFDGVQMQVLSTLMGGDQLLHDVGNDQHHQLLSALSRFLLVFPHFW